MKEGCLSKTLDSNIKKGFITEAEGYDDYFTFDNLEAERETLKKILARL